MTPTPLLEGRQEYVADDNTIRALNNEIRDLKKKLAHAELEAQHAKADIEQTLVKLRRMTLPFYQLLQAVHGEIDALGVSSDSTAEQSSPASAQKAEAWALWKNRLGNQCSRIIDALLAHGSLTRSQLCVATGITSGNMSQPLHKLNKPGLIRKDGDRISLVQL